MRRALLIAATLGLVGCGRTGDALFKKLPDGHPVDAESLDVDAAVPDAPPPDAPPSDARDAQ